MITPAIDNKAIIIRTRINIMKHERILLLSEYDDVVSSRLYGCL
jgi:hypothetical protein